MHLITLPLDEIDEAALPRDRTALDAAALADLQRSIAATGLRQPIEVFALACPEPPLRYGLISGLRRLTATRALCALDRGRPATIAAFLREPGTIAAALAAMVAENDIRADLSAWEKGRIATLTRDSGHFPTLDAAILALYPAADRSRRARLRALALVVDELDGCLAAPETLSLRQMLRLAAALRADFCDLIRTALAESSAAMPEAQWALLSPILDEAEASLKDPTRYRPGRPRRLLRPRSGLTVRREMTPDGWILRFTGPEATGMMMETVMDEIERMYG